MRRTVAVLSRRIRGGQENPLKLPHEGGSHFPTTDKKDPATVAGRLEQKVVGSQAVLGNLPKVSSHFSEEGKVMMKPREKVPSMELSPDALLANPKFKKAMMTVRNHLEAEEKWLDHRKAQTETEQGKDYPIAQPLHKILARAGIASGSDTEPFSNGKVKVNGVTIRDRKFLAKPTDDIRCTTKRVLIDYPRIWRAVKSKGDRSMMTSKLNQKLDKWRWQFPGLPNFAFLAGGGLSRDASGLLLFTNDKMLAQYIDNSHDIERDWEANVRGEFPIKLLKKLNTTYSYGNYVYKNMEWAIESVRYSGKFHRKQTDRSIMGCNLKIRIWGPGPPLQALLRDVQKPCSYLNRVTIGPYNTTYINPGLAVEAYIDEGLMQFTDPKWIPWIEAHSPLLARNTATILQKKVNMKRDGQDGAMALIEELEDTRTDALEATKKRRRSLQAEAPTSLDTALVKVNEKEFKEKKRRQIVGKGMPVKAQRSVSDILADLKKPPIMSGMS